MYSASYYRELGERIKAARHTSGMSQMEFSEKVGISNSHLSDIERGLTSFRVDILVRMSEVLQVSADQLLRPDIPHVAELTANELSAILSECTADESERILKLVRDMKDALHSSRNSSDK